ncbi:MAG TPA: deoxyribodipyrimidine photo-lyase [Bosea sp. (in: a-proteobacteria)]|jgi:deoxyribodipyrimidine photo-lyase|uniref:cryptochrome/photolyase family protein n=1 Tax=Bosea sp. (in: a-proteobacteria) TaxID=1871050 RepID=UPI002E12EAC1|nr:deoxyribodipyrimidine photo-lyase [Bosea sp. (in: a-proteobacteria)]
MAPSSLHWFRDDLRLADNPALTASVAHGSTLCLYILDEGGARRPLGGASRWWLSRSLEALAAALSARGGELVLMRGDPAMILPEVVAATGIDFVTWSRRYDAESIELDSRLKTIITTTGAKVASFNAALLNEPWQVTTKTGDPMKVFTPYWRAARSKGEPPAPIPAPGRIAALALAPAVAAMAVSLAELALEPSKPDWAGGLRQAWAPGEAAAAERLGEFLSGPLDGYGEGRDRPDRASTSRLSPHLRFGEISPRQIWHATRSAMESGEASAGSSDAEKFLSEVGWREFSYHLLFHNPGLATRNYNPRFDAFPWRRDEAALKAWQRGLTGYPIVDAGMRQLWTTGWMHNRVRMIAASFLIKHLLIDWRLGEAWFWDTLVDADPANNPASWQWVAGSGADASPYYRIFNPVTQGLKFDPKGAYVREWVPELAGLDDALIHEPWRADSQALAKAGIALGETYPNPVVELDFGRRRALDALAATRSAETD